MSVASCQCIGCQPDCYSREPEASVLPLLQAAWDVLNTSTDRNLIRITFLKFLFYPFPSLLATSYFCPAQDTTEVCLENLLSAFSPSHLLAVCIHFSVLTFRLYPGLV